MLPSACQQRVILSCTIIHPEIDTGERERILLYLLSLLVTGRITPRDVVTIHRERHARWRHGSAACGSALTLLTV